MLPVYLPCLNRATTLQASNTYITEERTLSIKRALVLAMYLSGT